MLQETSTTLCGFATCTPGVNPANPWPDVDAAAILDALDAKACAGESCGQHAIDWIYDTVRCDEAHALVVTGPHDQHAIAQLFVALQLRHGALDFDAASLRRLIGVLYRLNRRPRLETPDGVRHDRHESYLASNILDLQHDLQYDGQPTVPIVQAAREIGLID